ncbi:acyl-CoA N-acyltransferase [Aureobasidium sp. EXF-8845]|nr:acyl-CoA N-acyltransferase [Aureobasidium sp. EXF-8846]KAI4810405.1 acyl-CoA N-acyltransferase [Aureobasidium sp. EXF-8845]
MDGSVEPSSLPKLQYIQYDPDKEAQYLTAIRELISKDLSEPYSIYVYRYFLYQWADLCYMIWYTDFLLKTVDSSGDLIGVVVCKLEPHRGGPMRGYIAMLAVKKEHRGRGIASKLVRMAMDGMIAKDADEVGYLPRSDCKDHVTDSVEKITLETEIDNIPSLKLYERLGFLRTKRLHRYYLNGNSAYRMILYLKEGVASKQTQMPYDPPY